MIAVIQISSINSKLDFPIIGISPPDINNLSNSKVGTSKKDNILHGRMSSLNLEFTLR